MAAKTKKKQLTLNNDSNSYFKQAILIMRNVYIF